MAYSINSSKEEHDFSAVLRDKKVPLLVLDQKWHHIFVGSKKPDTILKPEKQVNELLLLQGRTQQELKELKKLKATLMNNIMENMEGTEGQGHPQSKKLSEDSRLIDEIKEKMENCEDILLDMPRQLKEANDVLMQETMDYCYKKLRINAADIEEIGEWIKNMRIELKKQIIRKQSAEIKNKEIYSYMHDIFGAQIVDLFDLKYESEEEEKLPENEKTE